MTPRNSIDHSTTDRIFVVTGADSGLGRAVAERLTSQGSVITCGIGDEVDIRADLSTQGGRSALIAEARRLSNGRIDGIVAAAGIGAAHQDTVSLNYFGTIAVLEGLRDCLKASGCGAAVIVSSSSTLNRGSAGLVRACVDGNEDKALASAQRLIRTGRGSQIYRSSKIALNSWVRTTAVAGNWAGEGIVLNAVAPGIIATDAVMRTWDQDRALLEIAMPQPLGLPGAVVPVADLIAFSVSGATHFMTGQVIYCDGGADALLRGARPQKVFLRYSLREIAAMVREARRRK